MTRLDRLEAIAKAAQAVVDNEKGSVPVLLKLLKGLRND